MIYTRLNDIEFLKKFSAKSGSKQMEFKLRFPETEIVKYAKSYSYTRNIEDVLKKIDPIQSKLFLKKQDLIYLAGWKAPRIVNLVETNEDGFVEEITTFAFSAITERARIESLTMLSGVGWPMASTILHFFHHKQYPIIDFRALWSLNVDEKINNFKDWEKYTLFCKKLADSSGIDMRTLDKALWQFSKENQPESNLGKESN